jgi:hypothetical protein
MGRRSRNRDRDPQRAPLAAPESQYADPAGNSLTLRGAMTPKTRTEYAAISAGDRLAPAGGREDAWHRAVEFLFERLAVRWEIAGVPLDGQRELLKRFRAASPDERAWIRATLRAHCAEHFPELEAP